MKCLSIHTNIIDSKSCTYSFHYCTPSSTSITLEALIQLIIYISEKKKTNNIHRNMHKSIFAKALFIYLLWFSFADVRNSTLKMVYACDSHENETQLESCASGGPLLESLCISWLPLNLWNVVDPTWQVPPAPPCPILLKLAPNMSLSGSEIWMNLNMKLVWFITW